MKKIIEEDTPPPFNSHMAGRIFSLTGPEKAAKSLVKSKGACFNKKGLTRIEVFRRISKNIAKKHMELCPWKGPQQAALELKTPGWNRNVAWPRHAWSADLHEGLCGTVWGYCSFKSSSSWLFWVADVTMPLARFVSSLIPGTYLKKTVKKQHVRSPKYGLYLFLNCRPVKPLLNYQHRPSIWG